MCLTNHLRRVKVQLPVSILSEEFAAAMTKQFMVSDLEFKRARIPGIVEGGILGMDEGKFLICVIAFSFVGRTVSM